jgi:hypothetical protein
MIDNVDSPGEVDEALSYEDAVAQDPAQASTHEQERIAEAEAPGNNEAIASVLREFEEEPPPYDRQQLAAAAYERGLNRQMQAEPPDFETSRSHPRNHPAGEDPALQNAPTRSLRQRVGNFSLQARSSRNDLQSVASSSSLRGAARGARYSDAPPVPALPLGVAPASTSRTAARSNDNQGVSGSEAGPSSGVQTSATPMSQRQLERNHRLRDAIRRGDETMVLRRLDKLDPGPTPQSPSSISRQNALHKMANSDKPLTTGTMDRIFAKIPVGSRAVAARAQDKDGNTPLHHVESNIGKLEYSSSVNFSHNPEHMNRFMHLSTKLKEAANAGTSAHETPIDEIQNRAGRTPQEERQHSAEGHNFVLFQ